jgi:L-fuconolactonase
MTRIDAHHHVWTFDPVRHAWIDENMRLLRRDFGPDDLAPLLRQHGIDGTILVQVEQTEAETRHFLDLAKAYPFIWGIVGWVDLRAPDIGRRLETFAAHDKLKGFRHIVQSEPDDFVLDPAFQRGIGHLQAFGFTYDLLIVPRHLPAAIRLVAAFPEQRFVLDHLAKPLMQTQAMEPWAAQIRTLAAYPNVWCKVSGLITEADHTAWTPADITPYLDVAFDAFGTDRLLFGSDWPVCLLAGTYTQVVELVETYLQDRTEEERAAVFGQNAVAFYDL